MRIVITGATGNIGTSCLLALSDDPNISEIVGLQRRVPTLSFPKTRFAQVDVGKDDLQAWFAGADAVIHLAWDLQPSHDRAELWRNNVDGSVRVMHAAAKAEVGALIYASSVAVYSPSGEQRVDESSPRGGIRSSSYSMQKVRVEQDLDALEAKNEKLRVVRMRPALVFKREAASAIRRLFIGPLVPKFLFKPGRIPIVPRGLSIQCVHSLDVGAAFRLATLENVRGAFNLAAEPLLDNETLARMLRARTLPIAPKTLRALAAASHALRLQPSEPGWVDLGFQAAKMSAERAQRELGWQARRTSGAALLELLDGLRNGSGLETPRLEPHPKHGARARFGRVEPITG